MKLLNFTATICLLVVLSISSASAQSKIKFDQPILITSAGQSADVTMASMLCKKVGLETKVAPKATASDISGIQTLIIVPGFSSKGLGAAGISREQEMGRVKDVIAAAQKQKIRILLLHIGGKPRRGQQSDDFNKLVAENAQHLIVVKQGDEDKFFSDIAGKQNVGIDLVEKIAEAMKPLEGSFNKK